MTSTFWSRTQRLRIRNYDSKINCGYNFFCWLYFIDFPINKNKKTETLVGEETALYSKCLLKHIQQSLGLFTFNTW